MVVKGSSVGVIVSTLCKDVCRVTEFVSRERLSRRCNGGLNRIRV